MFSRHLKKGGRKIELGFPKRLVQTRLVFVGLVSLSLYIPRVRSPAFSHEISNTSVEMEVLSACLHSFRFFWAIFVVLALGIGYVLVGICASWLCLRFVGRIVCFLLPFHSVPFLFFLSPSHVIHSLPFLFVKSYFSSIFRNAFWYPGIILRFAGFVVFIRPCDLQPNFSAVVLAKIFTLIFWVFENSEKKFHYCVFYISFGLAFVRFLQSDDGVIVVLT